MNQAKTVLKNIVSLFGAQILTSLLTPLLLIFIARKLGDEVFGKYSFIIALTQIFLIISDFGIKAVVIRDVARNPKKVSEYLGNIIILKLFFSTLTVLSLILFVTLLDRPHDTTIACYIFAAGLFFQSMSYAFRWVFHALQTMEYEALQRVAERALLLVLSLAALWKGLGLFALSIIFLITQIIILGLSLFFVAKRIKLPPMKINLSFCIYIIKTAVFFALCEVLWMIYFKIDQVMLPTIKGETELGWYSKGYLIVNFLSLIPMLLMTVMFPVLSHLYEKEKNRLRKTSERLFRYLTTIVLFLVPVIFILSDKIITIIYGPDNPHPIAALKILIFAALFVFPVHLLSHILASSNRHKTLALMNFLGVVVNIGLNLILIPKFSYSGAGIATIATQAMLCVLLYTAVSKFIKIEAPEFILKLLPGLAAMILIIYTGQNLFLWPSIALAILVYSGSAYLTGCIKNEDFSLLFGIFKIKSFRNTEDN
jgi:O-antigen/teichoic acid export membrane protein